MENGKKPAYGYYRHYKGNYYELIGIATHSETLEPLAVYRALYGDGKLWVRPLSMWSEPVEVGGKPVLRFTPVSPEEYEKETGKVGEGKPL